MSKLSNVVIKDKNTVYIAKDAILGKNVIIYPNNVIDKGCQIADNVTLFSGNIISNSSIGKGCKLQSSIIENSTLEDCCLIAPFCNIYKSSLHQNIIIQSFTTIKNSSVASNTKIGKFVTINNTIIKEPTYIGNRVTIVADKKEKVIIEKQNIIKENSIIKK